MLIETLDYIQPTNAKTHNFVTTQQVTSNTTTYSVGTVMKCTSAK